MRLPNGYGSVIKLGGKRRKPFAVRITNGYKEDERGMQHQVYKYLGYFEKSKEAYSFLADYNAGIQIKDYVSIADLPTFAEVYDMWYRFKESLQNKPGPASFRNYDIAYRQMNDLHHLKFRNIRVADLQPVVSKYKTKSSSCVRNIMLVLRGMYEYALKYEIAEKDYSQFLTVEWTKNTEEYHIPFSVAEIEKLWANADRKDVYVVLIMIYTGLRASEFLNLKTENIHLEEQYFIAGMKTEAGTDRKIPICDKLLPLFRRYYDETSTYFYPNTAGKAYRFTAFNNTNWKNVMKKLAMDHKPHDTRHTCATLMEKAGISSFHRKLILGHAVTDITDGTYTHVDIQDLVKDINLL